MNSNIEESIGKKIAHLYGESQQQEIMNRLKELMEKYQSGGSSSPAWVSEKDVMLITYGDSIVKEGEAPLQSLESFLQTFIKDSISSVHILPFYPYTSDDGFSVVDYREINPDLGKWENVESISNNYKLMFDAVINHISKSSSWFQGYLNGETEYANYFTEKEPGVDYSKVVRPRALPLFTAFETKEGTKEVWTTFSDDQIDLNFQEPKVLLQVMDILLMYAQKGAKYIRLDAVGFIWKKQNTTCIHLEEAHAIVKLIREVFEAVGSETIIITETNVPHKENISYFGNGMDEAHMVYQFPLPPLTLFSFHQQNARKLLDWLNALEMPAGKTTFFNFLASHDGIGMRPTEGLLTEAERELMLQKTVEHGGFVSYKDNGDGTKSPYELNINYFDALTSPEETLETGKAKMLAAQTILLSLAGVPGIYIHSLLGSRNDREGAETSGIYRRINREKLQKDELFSELDDSNSLRNHVFNEMLKRINHRNQEKSFHPQAMQEVLFLDDRVFSIRRTSMDEKEQMVVLVNISSQEVEVTLSDIDAGVDILTGEEVNGTYRVKPYQTLWIKK